MSKCKKTQDMFSDYRTDLLSEEQCADVERHVRECADCARELELLDSVLAMVEDKVSEYEPPVGLWNGVYNRITDPAPEPAGFLNGVRRWISVPVRAAGMGAAALAIAAGVYFAIPASQPLDPSRTGPADEYIQGYASYAGQASITDQAAYLTMVEHSPNPSVTN